MKSGLELFKCKRDIAVVTGGLGNLGPYWIKALLDAGSKVVSIDLPNMKIPQNLKIFIDKNFHSYVGDIISTDQMKKLHQKITKEIGLVSILVNNAGIDAPAIKNIYLPQDKEILSKKNVKMWQVNVQGAADCVEEFLSDMKKLKRGNIINIGSVYIDRSPIENNYVHLGMDKPWAYASTKAALHQVTRHYATRLAKYGIRVNTLSPGGVLGNQDKTFVKKYSQRVPLGRMASKEKDLAGPLIFLASAASSYVTGINLQVNGGYTAW